MNLSNATYDAILSDWWEYNDPRYIKEIRYLGHDNSNNIQYVVHIYRDDETDEVLVEKSKISIDELGKFVSSYL